ncbi:RND efflux system, inner membrane transporter [hydrothermal vent metagenome]|uniref:RND efflux system, inner membrane transporter n=1 Tax=hydrothermal vent metagenome TaxID=652676 RepID=A0A3B1C370_9ZZZZ
MWLIRFSIENPVKVTVAVLYMLIFGAISIADIPIQLTPTVDKPEIQVRTSFPGAAPQEVEEQVTIPIEEKLQAVEGLTRLTSSSKEGSSSVELEFEWGVDKDIALIDILKRISTVKNLPDDADTPIIIAGTSSERRPIYWASLRGSLPVNKMRQFTKDYIVPRVERIEGVSEVRIYGGEEREVRIALDFTALGARGLTVKDISQALVRENLNVRGGHIDIGKRKYLVRTVGLFKNVSDIESVIVAKDIDGRPVYIRDVATVYDTFKDRTSMVRIMGEPAIALGIIKKSGANTIKVVNQLESLFEKLNREIKSKNVAIHESYDSSDYIWESIGFVTSNLGFGALLAVLVLLFFLRSVRSTLVIGISIPIVIMTGFILLNLFGRTLNIISLAGMAFAVGMVVDNAIVVLENIFRHMQEGADRKKAALEGTAEVWGAILASTLTTIAVFIPIMFIKEEAGQLFKDIAIAISLSVAISLIVSITVIPALASRLMRFSGNKKNIAPQKGALATFGLSIKNFFVWSITAISRFPLFAKLAVIVLIVTLATATLPLAPKMEYLPKGNRNLIFIFFKPHVGSNIDTTQKYSDVIADKILAFPEIKYMFHVVSSRFNGIGTRVKDEYRGDIGAVAEKINGVLYGSPGFEHVMAFQSSLFSRILGADMQVEVKGPNLDKVAEYSTEIQEELSTVKGVKFARTNLETGNPELRVTIDRERAADLQLSVQDIAEVIESLVAGKKATLYKIGGEEIDVVIKGVEETIVDAHSLEEVTVYNINGAGVRLDSVAKVTEATGPTQINHIEMDRAVSLSVTKERDAPLQAVVEEMNRKVLDPVREKMDLGYSITLSGHAKDLKATASALTGSFVLALVIIYLLMAALYESFLYPILIMFAVPLSASGALIGISLTGSRLDMLTMLGLIILAGIVVNNAILLIHQAIRNREKRGMRADEAIIESVKMRIRPIFMSAITTVFGMLPLVIRSGPGSELYSGLASAIVGGLLVSTVFTLLLIPALYLALADIRGETKNA